jgi:acetyl-CoA synthetase
VNGTEAFRAARDVLFQHRVDLEGARRDFRWPALDAFNWATDWFDVIAQGNDAPALRVVGDGAVTRTFAELSESSTRIASALHDLGVRRGDRVLLMLGNELALWEAMLAAMKLGAVVVPATTLLSGVDLLDRFERGHVRHVVVGEAHADKLAVVEQPFTRIVVGKAAGWQSFDALRGGDVAFRAPGVTRAIDPLLLYFTSGTTAKPKLVLHTHQSYPVGHLSTMYWLGLREGDVHLNISSPGWAKHAWSCFFAPWNAGATILAHNQARFSATETLRVVRDAGVTTLCAPPTVWRMVILEDLGERPPALRELASAGEPLNPEVIATVERAWGITIRDGYGQTETTAQIGNSPGQAVVPGSMGRALPGYDIALVDSTGREVEEGEIAVRLAGGAAGGPLGLMTGYLDDDERTREVMAGGFYRTGDQAMATDGRFHYVARRDDVFKSSDYRISPFELESALLEHPYVAEAAVVPSPDPLRLAVPKAFVVLCPGVSPDEASARAIFESVNQRLAPYQRVRRLEFAALPKTISGKIRRVELRALEAERRATGERGAQEFFVEDYLR